MRSLDDQSVPPHADAKTKIMTPAIPSFIIGTRRGVSTSTPHKKGVDQDFYLSQRANPRLHPVCMRTENILDHGLRVNHRVAYAVSDVRER